MRGFGEKKGLSPVVATVLLIALVMVLASIVFLWAKGFVTEQIQKFNEPVENACSSVDFEAEVISSQSGYNTLEIVNKGNIDIYQLEIKMLDGEGNSEVSRFKYNVDAGSSVSGEVPLTMSGGARPNEIIIYPALVGSVSGKDTNKVFTCLDSGKIIKL